MPRACSSPRKAIRSCRLRPRRSTDQGHDDIELPSAGVAAQRIECRPLVAALGAADAVILVDLDDLAAHASRDLPKLPLLVGRRLVNGGNPKVENRLRSR